MRDKVDILAGFALTPKRSAPPTSRPKAKKFMVDHERRDLDHHRPSRPTLSRTSLTLPQVAETARHLGGHKGGVEESLYDGLAISAPAIDAEAGFQRAFKEAGGEIVGSVRMPVANPDFSAFVQRAKDLNPESIFIFVPGGAQPAAIGKAFAERGIDPAKIKIIWHRRS